MAKAREPKTDLEIALEEMVVFIHPDTGPFSMDRRWNDREIREAWINANVQDQENDEPTYIDGPEDEDEDVRPYSEWTNDELRAELSERKLPVDGTKAQLVARLTKDDAENPPE